MHIVIMESSIIFSFHREKDVFSDDDVTFPNDDASSQRAKEIKPL